MASADALGVLGPLAGGDQLGQAVVADLDDPFLHEQIGRLQIAVNDSMIVQVGDSLDQSLEPVANLGQRHPVRVLLQNAGQARSGDILHDDERVARVARLQIEDRQQVRALQVHAVHDPAPLDVEIAQDELERDFLAGIGRGVINLAEPASPDGTLDRVAIERSGARAEAIATLRAGMLSWRWTCLSFPWVFGP